MTDEEVKARVTSITNHFKDYSANVNKLMHHVLAELEPQPLPTHPLYRLEEINRRKKHKADLIQSIKTFIGETK